MKRTIALVIVFTLILCNGNLVWADEVSELKEQLKALQETTAALSAKIEALEAKQEAQAKEIKKVPGLAQSVSELKERPASLLEGATVGGHLKLYMLDQTQGKHNSDAQHNNLSAGIHHLFLYFSKELSDILQLEVQTDTSVSASATPSLGSDIGRATTATTSTIIHQAFLSMLLPKDIELRAGIFNPMFSEEYAKETWWHELYHQNVGLVNLQSWHDTGIELYKNFDFDKWSLPAYFYLLNGNDSSRYVDNDGNKTILVHIAPELFQTKLRLLGSLSYGRWGSHEGDDRLRYVYGFDWKYQKFNLTSEYIHSKWDNLDATSTVKADGEKEGYYIRALYKFTPKWAGLIKYSHVELYKTGISTMRSDNYDTSTVALDFSLTPNSTIIGQYSYVDAKRSDDSDKIKAQRYTLGWRTTF